MRILKASADLYFQNGAGRDDSFVSVLKVPTSAQGFIDGALLSVSASTELLCASAQLLKKYIRVRGKSADSLLHMCAFYEAR